MEYSDFSILRAVEDVAALLRRIVGQLTKEPIDIEKLIEILKFILLSGGTTQEQLKAKFELTEKNQLRRCAH
jgi:hypothetical protein